MDYKQPSNASRGVQMGAEFLTEATGIIVKTPDETKLDNTYGVYSNRLLLLSNVDMGALDQPVSVKRSNCKNSQHKAFGEKKMGLSNYLLVPMEKHYGFNSSTLVKGMKVLIDLIDRDPSSYRIRPIDFDQLKSLQKTDIRNFYIPATENEGEQLNDDNTYFVRLDSVNKQIKIATSMSNGESHSYKLIFNGHNGMMSLTDNEDRAFSIVSSEDTIKMKNKAGSFIELKEDVITIEADTLNIGMGTDINIKSTNLNIENDNTKIKADSFKGELDTNEIKGTKISGKYDSMEWKGNKHSIDAASQVIKGTVTVDGEINTKKLVLDWMQAGSAGLPTGPSATTTLANFKGVGGMPVVTAPALIPFLTAQAAIVDSLGALIGLPPTMTSMCASSAPNFQSTCLMG